MAKKNPSLLARARSWTTKNKLHGPHAFMRFVMLVFVDRLNKSSNEFILKGGNLLWVYIKTPRATVDLDFVTRSLTDHESVKVNLENFCNEKYSDIKFNMLKFSPIEIKGQSGAEVTIAYETETGQSNKFDLDIVYGLESSITSIDSPIGDEASIQAVTIENIIADKLATAHRFRSGNSRMKDFDDLWRISQIGKDTINWKQLAEILRERKISPKLSKEWVNTQIEKSWAYHNKRNRGLPINIEDLIDQVNDWLGKSI